MTKPSNLMTWLKWFSISWTICAIAVVLISHFMIVYEWSPITGLMPYNVKDSTKVMLLLAPGAIAAAIHLFLEKRIKSGRAQKENQ